MPEEPETRAARMMPRSTRAGARRRLYRIHCDNWKTERTDRRCVRSTPVDAQVVRQGAVVFAGDDSFTLTETSDMSFLAFFYMRCVPEIEGEEAARPRLFARWMSRRM